MASGKRALEATTISDDLLSQSPAALSPSPSLSSSPSKRRRLTPNERTTTKAAYKVLQNLYAITQSIDEFAGLCAYLCTVLRLGYVIQTPELDHFITDYDVYVERYSLESLKCKLDDPDSGSELSVPAYHVWFKHHKDVHKTSHRVLTEQVLRTIWEENPLFKSQAQRAYEAICTKWESQKRVQRW